MMRKRGGSVKGVSHRIKAAPPMQGKGATSRAIKPAKQGMGMAMRDEAAPPAPTGVGDRMPPDSLAWKDGKKNGTALQHTNGKTDGPDMGRKKPITFARGGLVKPGHPIRPVKPDGATPLPGYTAMPKRKHGGPVNANGTGAARPAPAINGKGRTSMETPPAFKGGDHTSRAERAVKPGSYPIKFSAKGGMGRLEKARKAGPHGAP